MRPAAVFGSATLGVIVTSALLMPGCVQHRVERTSPAETGPTIVSRLRAEVAGKRPAYVASGHEGQRLWKLTSDLYAGRDYQPAWLDGTSPTPRIQELIEALRAAEAEGLDPAIYNVELLDAIRQPERRRFFGRGTLPVDVAGPLDVQLTYTYLAYASDLAAGVGDLAQADPAWQIAPEPFDPAAHLREALESGRIRPSLEALVPTAPQYATLRAALAAHRDVVARGGWPAVAQDLRVKPGQRSRAVAAVARRLAASGDYTGPVPEATDAVMAYDESLQAAVRAFQARHGLEEDASVGPAVVGAMNVTAAARVEQIALNMERWRWLPRDIGSRYILVNIPAYHLEVWDRGRVPLAMRVVVGRKDMPTPIFDDRMTYLVFSPYWNVPPDIARDETLPSVLNDRAFLDRADMEVVDARGQVVDVADVDLDDPTSYRFRQRPGRSNSLGLVKFMFPNQFNVYLHDTPADSLFARAGRSLSHGCVRVEDPQALAAYVLRDQPDWTGDRIREAMQAGEEETVKLSAPLPVYLGYWTAAAMADGTLRFVEDVYGVDGRQARLMRERLKGLRQRAAVSAAAAPAAVVP